MPSVTQFPSQSPTETSRELTPSLVLSLNGRTTALTLLMLPLLMYLGFWQLERAKQKQQLLQAYQKQQQEAPLLLNNLSVKTIEDLHNYTLVTLVGHFDLQRSWLLDNKTRAGRVGYEVVTPFVLNSGSAAGRALLVNRGWIPARARREQLPEIPTVTGELTLFASIYQPISNPLLNAEAEGPVWPRVTAELTLPLAAQSLGAKLLSRQVRLNAASPAALVTDWRTINVRPEKHTGYAVQWFAMAGGLVVWFIGASTNLISIIICAAKKLYRQKFCRRKLHRQHEVGRTSGTE